MLARLRVVGFLFWMAGWVFNWGDHGFSFALESLVLSQDSYPGIDDARMMLARLIIVVDEVEEVGVIQAGVEGVTVDNEGGRRDAPIEVVKLGDEGVGEDEVVVDEGTFGVAGAFRDTPTQGFVGTWQDFGLTGSVLGFDLWGMYSLLMERILAMLAGCSLA